MTRSIGTFVTCSPAKGGCGFLGHYAEFGSSRKPSCPSCQRSQERHVILSQANLDQYTFGAIRDLGLKLLTNHEDVTTIANCVAELLFLGCTHHAEEGIPCVHDEIGRAHV